MTVGAVARPEGAGAADGRTGGRADWAEALRAAGAARFAAVGYPTTKDEDWRFTPVAPIANGTFGDAGAAEVNAAALAPFLFGQAAWSQIVFVNGRYAAALSSVASLPAGVTVGTVAHAWQDGAAVAREHLGAHATVELTPFGALNASQLQDGALVHVAANVVVPHPIHVVFVTTPSAASAALHPRHLIVVERGARASVIESYVTLADGASYFTNAVCEVVTGENAWLEHVRLQRESERAYHVGLTVVDQARDSHYRSFTLALGGQISRHDLKVRLGAANTEALMYGLYWGRAEQLVDNHTAIHHDHPHCNSWEVYKGVLDDKSHGVFNGKIFVTPEAQKTDAKQTNRALLLSETAKIDTKPQLEIFADDVKCTHGATVGFLDDLMRFYLRSRGIPAADVDKLLTYAFASEVIAEVAIEPVRAELDRLVRARCGVA